MQTLVDHWRGTIPIDPRLIARGMGLLVLEEDLGMAVSGEIETVAGNVVIRVNKSENKLRRRFTLAHEIGHYIQRGNTREIGHVDYRSQLSKSGTDPDELFANAFAAELLMPHIAVEELLATGVGAEQMAREMKVTRLAMATRLESLGLTPSG